MVYNQLADMVPLVVFGVSFDPRYLRCVWTSCSIFRNTLAGEAGLSTWLSVLLAVLISCTLLPLHTS